MVHIYIYICRWRVKHFVCPLNFHMWTTKREGHALTKVHFFLTIKNCGVILSQFSDAFKFRAKFSWAKFRAIFLTIQFSIHRWFFPLNSPSTSVIFHCHPAPDRRLKVFPCGASIKVQPESLNSMSFSCRKAFLIWRFPKEKQTLFPFKPLSFDYKFLKNFPVNTWKIFEKYVKFSYIFKSSNFHSKSQTQWLLASTSTNKLPTHLCKTVPKTNPLKLQDRSKNPFKTIIYHNWIKQNYLLWKPWQFHYLFCSFGSYTLSIYLSTYLPTYLSIYLSIHPSVYMYKYVYIYIYCIRIYVYYMYTYM